jgi:hypothetical protein
MLRQRFEKILLSNANFRVRLTSYLLKEVIQYIQSPFLSNSYSVYQSLKINIILSLVLEESMIVYKHIVKTTKRYCQDDYGQ